MAVMTPYNQIVGTCKFYLAAYGATEPAINATPDPTLWVEFGSTDGDQVVTDDGDLTKFKDNDHLGSVKAVLPEQDVMVKATLANSTQEMLARIKSNVSQVVTTTSGGANVKKLAFKRQINPTEYALLMRGSSDSPYGNFPGQNYFPRGVFNGASEITRARDGRQETEFEFHVLEDDAQADGYQMGWGTVQIS